jgi:quinone-modifying oxidoreductase subunit QmoA
VSGVLIIGGGISGITSAVEIAEIGYEVYLVEKNPYLGGRVVQMNKYFPKLCPPYCGLEINLRRIRQNPKIKVFTLSEVTKISGEKGNFEAEIKVNPRYVNSKCTSCGDCTEACTYERPNQFNYGMDKTKAIYLPHEMSYPLRYVIDMNACTKCGACVDACKYDAIDLDMQPEIINIKINAVIVTTGWAPYDATKLTNLGFGIHQNVITNVMMERLSAVNGPTGGRIIRPSDEKEVKTVAFVQCAGSRDENHLPYCSAVCCLGSLKQATYIREQDPESKVYIFYIDVRAMGKYEDFYAKVQSDENIILIKGKVAKINEDPATKNLLVEAEDILSGTKVKQEVDLVVLATGMIPTTRQNGLPLTGIEYDEYGFINPALSNGGIYGAGVAKRPIDIATSVQDATGAALKAIQCMVRR